MKLNYHPYYKVKSVGYNLLNVLRILLFLAALSFIIFIFFAELSVNNELSINKNLSVDSNISVGNESQNNKLSSNDNIVNELEKSEALSVYDENKYDNNLLKNNNSDNDLFYNTQKPENSLNIKKADISANILLSAINETSYDVDFSSIAKNISKKSDNIFPVIKTSEEVLNLKKDPLVLILHTHGTEAYSNGEWCETDYNFRSDDINENVVAVGEAMYETLLSNGIPSIHCTVMHDKDSYINSYSRAAETIKNYLAEYPTIKYVFDIHRDAIAKPNGDIIRPVTYDKYGNSVAQVMSVVGTDFLGASHPNWRDNLSLATSLQLQLDNICENIARPINIRSAAFNEQYSKGSLLLEIGSSGNTLEEAKNAAVILGEAIAQIIITTD